LCCIIGIVFFFFLGTWRQEAKANVDELVKVPNDIPVAYAASLVINPATSYRLLRDFGSLSRGDVIIQNGANSMVGIGIIQMAKQLGVKTINIVRENRLVFLSNVCSFLSSTFFSCKTLFLMFLISHFDRPEAANTLRLLTNLGGDVNVTDSYAKTADFHEIVREMGGCKLAFNCVGGESVTDLARVLASNGTLVTYGGMSKQPIAIPFDLLTHKQLQLKGFWIAKWYETHSKEEAAEMFDDISSMVRDDKLTYFFRMHDLDDFPFALEKATEPFQNRKVVLNCDFPDRMKEHDNRDKKDYEMFEAPIV
jgi:trans-2-enoyl-CoA reductase